MKAAEKKDLYVSTQNPCKLCAPLGAAFVFKGISGAISLLHGSQGCSTYIRRYMISHFKEPVDIASSNFSENTAIFGGEDNLKKAISNIIVQYKPTLIGIASTCLSETIGEDVAMILRAYYEEHIEEELPFFINVSTASYRGTHMDGFHETVLAVVKGLSRTKSKNTHFRSINMFPGMVSPEDIRHLKEIFKDYAVKAVLLPDYSQTLDGPSWKTYQKIPQGGTVIEEIQSMPDQSATIEFGVILKEGNSAGKFLQDKFQIPNYGLVHPIGIKANDCFFKTLSTISGKDIPAKYKEERGRLVDAYVDAHKYVFAKRAIIYGEEDLVIALASFLSEIGVVPALCATGGKSGYFENKLKEFLPAKMTEQITIMDGVDFKTIEEKALLGQYDFLIGNSKGLQLSRDLKLPLIRVGFPIHDRIGGARILHLGYRGTQRLFDQIVNILLEVKQTNSAVGYSYQ